MRTILLFTLLLGGCATSTAQLGTREAALVFEGTRDAEEAASCLVAELIGTNQLLKMGPGHFVVTRPNGYGVPIVRWDIYDTETGNRVELRASFGVGVGENKARACAGAPAAALRPATPLQPRRA